MAHPQALEELMVSLQRLGRLLGSRQVTSRITAVAGVEVSQQGIALLQGLRREGRQSLASLATAAAMDLGAASRQVRMLEEQGAVQRSRSEDDGRVTLLELTPEGRRTIERIHAVRVQHLEEALGDWSDDDERTLATLMRRLVEDLVRTPVRPEGTLAQATPAEGAADAGPESPTR